MIPFHVSTRDKWVKAEALHAQMRALGAEFGPPVAEAEVIRRNVNWLLNRCYVPDAENGCHVTDEALRFAGVSGAWAESINWGDLHAGVEQFGTAFIVIIEEAEPGCVELCAWVADWLERWGWPNVRVETEW